MCAETASPDDQIKRFSQGRIFEHWLHVVTFGVLVCTGLSQKYYSLEFSQWVILFLGGIDNVRLIHRVAGAIFCVELAVHLAIAAAGIIYGRWQPTMIITKKDFTDVVHNIRYYLNMENSPAGGGRYTYKQKFEYWAILSGVMLMMITGLILWFPVWVTRLLPGEIIPAAKVLHSNEALSRIHHHFHLAYLQRSVQPGGVSARYEHFTGSLSRERMLREHPDEIPEPGPEGERNSRPLL